MGQDGVDPVGPRVRARGRRRRPAHVADDALDPAVAGRDQIPVEVDPLPRRLAAHVVDPLPHRRRQALDVVVVGIGGVRQQRPDRPRPASGRRPHERSPVERTLDLGDGGLGPRRQAHLRRLAAHRESDGAADRAAQRIEALPGGGDGRDRLHPEPVAELRGVHRDAGGGRLVDHVEGDDHGDAGLDDLQHQVEPALEGAGVDHDDDGIGKVAAPAEDLVHRHLLVQRVRAQAVGARQVDDLGPRAARQRDLPRGAGDGHSGVVADARPRPGQCVEDGGLARVGVARDEDPRDRRGAVGARGMGREACRCGGSAASVIGSSGAPARTRGCVATDVRVGIEARVPVRGERDAGCLGAPQAQKVAPEPDLEGVAERCAADHLDRGAGEQPHLHEAAPHALLAGHAGDDGAPPDRQLVECAEALVHAEAPMPATDTRRRVVATRPDPGFGSSLLQAACGAGPGRGPAEVAGRFDVGPPCGARPAGAGRPRHLPQPTAGSPCAGGRRRRSGTRARR